MNDPTQHALIYQWWPHRSDDRAAHNSFAPIIASIATFRRFNPHIAIYVLDYGGGNFEDFPARLNFKVIVRPSYFDANVPVREIKTLPYGVTYTGKGPDSANPVGADIFHMRFCSRPFDVWDLAQSIPQKYITYCDSDVFWFAPLIPFHSDPKKLCIRHDNTGIFYFDKRSPVVNTFFDMWKAYIYMARNDPEYRRKLVCEFPKPIYISEEKVFLHLIANVPTVCSSLVERIDNHEMLMSWDYAAGKKIDYHSIKSIHATGSLFGEQKIRVPLLFRETFEALRDVYQPEELIELYGKMMQYQGIFSSSDLGRSVADPFFADLRAKVYCCD